MPVVKTKRKCSHGKQDNLLEQGLAGKLVYFVTSEKGGDEIRS